MYSNCKLEGDGCIMEKKSLWRFFKKGMKSLKMQLNDWIHKRTKLMIAVRDLDEERVRKLLRKMDVNEVDKDGNTALMYMPNGCVGKNKRAKNILDMLVVAGIDLNKLNKRGRTALMQACEDRDYDMVDYLLGKGADFDIVNKQGKKAINYTDGDDAMRDKLIRFIKDRENENEMDPHYERFGEAVENNMQDVLREEKYIWDVKEKEKRRFNKEINQGIKVWASDEKAESKDKGVNTEELGKIVKNNNTFINTMKRDASRDTEADASIESNKKAVLREEIGSKDKGVNTGELGKIVENNNTFINIMKSYEENDPWKDASRDTEASKDKSRGYSI